MEERQQPLGGDTAAAATPAPQEAPAPEAQPEAEPLGLLLRGVVSMRGHERALLKLAVSSGEELIEHAGLGALVCVVPYRVPDWDRALIREHGSAVERAMRRCTIAPAPYGIVFRDREQVVRFLEDQHIALDEVLAFLDGTFEMRLHIRPSGRRFVASESDQMDRAASFYTALRRRSRAAFTFPPAGQRILSAAFLVSRADWVNFVEYADSLDAEHPEFHFDLTGPWPPYDFVRMTFLPREVEGE
jgi:hypothetical protein